MRYLKKGEKVKYKNRVWTVKWVGLDKFYIITNHKTDKKVDGKELKIE